MSFGGLRAVGLSDGPAECGGVQGAGHGGGGGEFGGEALGGPPPSAGLAATSPSRGGSWAFPVSRMIFLHRWRLSKRRRVRFAAGLCLLARAVCARWFTCDVRVTFDRLRHAGGAPPPGNSMVPLALTRPLRVPRCGEDPNEKARRHCCHRASPGLATLGGGSARRHPETVTYGGAWSSCSCASFCRSSTRSCSGASISSPCAPSWCRSSCGF